MGSHPANLALRFALELVALFSFGLWGWRLSEGWTRWLLVVLVPSAAAAIWGTFAVADDPSRSGAAPVPIAGVLRLLLELGFFAAAVLCLRSVGWERWAVAVALIVILHYAVSYDRVVWLVRQ